MARAANAKAIQFKVDRLQIILVGTKYIYVSQLLYRQLKRDIELVNRNASLISVTRKWPGTISPYNGILI